MAAAIELSIGNRRRVAVALSGGIDSAAVAALAVEALGPDQVEAFTYEFDDPAHPVETPYATAVCRKLGIRRHHVFRITLRDYLAAIPETVWRAENFTHWPKAFMLPAARKIRDAGFDAFLSGFGIGSHMAFFDDFARLLSWLPLQTILPMIWKQARFHQHYSLERLEYLHPGLAAPNRRVYFLLLCLLWSRGRIRDISKFYPREVRPLLQGITESLTLDPSFHDRSLSDLFRHHSFDHLISCIDVTRWEKPLREIGACRVSPAHFASCLPYAYLPTASQPFVWSRNRALRPGKQLLRLAMQDCLPDAVLYRKKSWDDAVVSRSWLRAGIRWMRSVLPATPSFPMPATAGFSEALKYWDTHSPHATVTALAFWHLIFIEREPTAQPPSWDDLTEVGCGNR